MSPISKTILWSLSLITIVYISNQYLEIQRLKTAQHIERSSQKEQAYKITQVGGQVMRVNESTGETYYWSAQDGGWVKVNETNLVTAVSDDERKKRISIIRAWYDSLDTSGKRLTQYEAFEADLINTPSWQLQDNFNKWQAEQKREQRRGMIQTWYKQLTPAEQAATPYQAFEEKLIEATDLEFRQSTIKSWYELMDTTYIKQVPYDRFEAIEISSSLDSLNAALEQQRKYQGSQAQAASNSSIVFCPIGGETYDAKVKFCPKHGVATRTLITKQQKGT